MSPAPASDTQTRDSHSLFAALEAELAQGASRGADKLAPYAAGGLERYCVDRMVHEFAEKYKFLLFALCF